MSLYKKYPIKMTSNTTPIPFESNQYVVFDCDKSTGYNCGYGSFPQFNIKLDKKIQLNKVKIKYNNGYYTSSGSTTIYGIDNDNKDTLSSTSGIFSEKIIDNNKSYNNYGFLITYTFASGIIYEIELYEEAKYSIFNNNNYYYMDDEDNILSYDDINLLNNNYGATLSELNDIINKSDNLYPFKIVKRKV